MNAVYVCAPASTGNFGPGFDVLAAALGLYQELEVRWLSRPGLDLRIEGEQEEGFSDPSRNLICRILSRRIKGYFPRRGLFIRTTNGIPISRGLGSSAAARLAAFAAAEALNGKRDFRRALLDTVREEGHPDNAAASFYGGLVSCGSTKQGFWSRSWRLPGDLNAVVAVPEIRLPTHRARSILPSRVPMADAVHNLSGVAGILWSLSHRDYDRLNEYMRDFLHQPYRKKLLPPMDRVIAAALRAGAVGASLSGAGSSILAIARNGQNLENIGRAMCRAFANGRVRSRHLILPFDHRGLRVKTI